MPKSIPMEEIVRRNGGTIIGVHDREKEQYILKCNDNTHSVFISNRAYIENCYHFCPMCIKFQMEKYAKYSVYLIFNRKYEFCCRKPEWLQCLYNYHIDLYNEELLFALEVDGNTHDGQEAYYVKLLAKHGVDDDPLYRDWLKDNHARKHGINILRLNYNNTSLKPHHYSKIKGELYDLIHSAYGDKCDLMPKDDFLALSYTIDDAKLYYFNMRKEEANRHIRTKGSATMIDFKYGPRRTKCIEVSCSRDGCNESKYWSFDDVTRTDDNYRMLCCETCVPTNVSDDRIKDFIEDRLHIYMYHTRRTDNKGRTRIYVSFKCHVCNNVHEQMWDNIYRRLTYNKCPISAEGRGNRTSKEDMNAIEAGLPSCMSVTKRHNTLSRVSELICNSTGMRFNTTLESIKQNPQCIPCGLSTYLSTIKQHMPDITITFQGDLLQHSYGDHGVCIKHGHSWPFLCGKCGEVYHVCRFSLVPKDTHKCIQEAMQKTLSSRSSTKAADRRHKDKMIQQKDMEKRIIDYCVKMNGNIVKLDHKKSIVTIKCNNEGHDEFDASMDSLLHNKSWCLTCSKNAFKKALTVYLYELTGHAFVLRKSPHAPNNYTLVTDDVCIELIPEGKRRMKAVNINAMEQHYVQLKYKKPVITAHIKAFLYEEMGYIFESLSMDKDTFIDMDMPLVDVYKSYESIKSMIIEEAIEAKGAKLIAKMDEHGLITTSCPKCGIGRGKWTYQDIMATQRSLHCEGCKPLKLTDELVQSKLDMFEHKLVNMSYKDTEPYVSFICSKCNETHEYSYKSIRAAYNGETQSSLCTNNKERKPSDDNMVLDRIKECPIISHVSLVDNNRKLSKPSVVWCPLANMKFKVDKLEHLIGKKGSLLPKCMACIINKYIKASSGSIRLVTDPLNGLRATSFHCDACGADWVKNITSTTTDYHKC